MKIDYSKLTPEEVAQVQRVLSVNLTAPAVQGLSETSGSARAQQQEIKNNAGKAEWGANEAAMMGDAALGSSMMGQYLNALTPQIQKNVIPKTGQFITRQVLPRLLAGSAMTTMGPFGTVTGLVAPELAMQGAELLAEQSPRPSNLPASPDRMTQIVQQNPQLSGSPDVFLKAMQGPQALNALNLR